MKLQRLQIMKAEPTGIKEVPDFIIETIPASFTLDGSETGKEFYERRHREHAEEAQRLLDILADSLPQGTMDALLYKLLERKASIMVVAGYGV